jgi:uncharacterized membrane protein YadS
MKLGFMAADVLGQQLLAWQGITMSASPISGIPVSILVGLAINNAVLTSLPDSYTKALAPGLAFCSKTLLQLGIVCVGTKLSMLDLVTAGAVGLPIIAASVGAGLTVIPRLGRAAGLDPKMTSLITAGTSICGVTAITAVAPAIAADQKAQGFAIANVVAFGTVGMLVYPYLAHFLLTTGVLPSVQHVGIFLGEYAADARPARGAG